MTSLQSLSDSIKRRAKRIRKATGVPHHRALNEASVEFGFSNYKHFLNSHPVIQKNISLVHQIIPDQLPRRSAVTGEGRFKRPNKKLPIEMHSEIGGLIKEVIQRSTRRKSVINPLNKLRCKLDDWAAAEYPSQTELSNDVFFDLYYHERNLSLEKKLTEDELVLLLNKLKKLKELLVSNYPACTPLEEILKYVSMSETALVNWTNPEKKSLPKELVAVSRNRFARIPFGTIVRVKPEKNDFAIVLENEGAVRVYGRFGEGYFGREEVSISKAQSVKLVDPQRLYLPYGKWVCENGTEVLFNRDYHPIWVKYLDGRVEEMDPSRWISYKGQTWFFNDGNPPWDNKKTLLECTAVLKDWGIDKKVPSTMKQFLSFIEKGGKRFKIEKNSQDKFEG